MQLPDKFGVQHADTDDLQLFLEHLYFPSAHPFPPFVPGARVDLSAAKQDAAARCLSSLHWTLRP